LKLRDAPGSRRCGPDPSTRGLPWLLPWLLLLRLLLPWLLPWLLLRLFGATAREVALRSAPDRPSLSSPPTPTT
jgi:hypothetical protein